MQILVIVSRFNTDVMGPLKSTQKDVDEPPFSPYF
jgi:hypothetical protein